MRNYIDKNHKKNEIRLLFRHPSYIGKIIIAVEGQSDVRLFRSILEHERIKVETIDGKQQLLSTMRELVEEFPQRIFAVCDADYDHLNIKNQDASQYSIYMTDEHDAEIMLLNSLALDAFILEYSSQANLEVIRSQLLDHTFSCAYLIGLVKWMNATKDLKLIFEGLNFCQFIDVKNLDININVDLLLSKLLRRSPNKSEEVTLDYLQRGLEELKIRQVCKMQVCSGHDLTQIIAMVYRQKWASVDLNMNQKKVESALRVGYQKLYFKDTQLCENLCTALAGVGIELEMC